MNDGDVMLFVLKHKSEIISSSKDSNYMSGTIEIQCCFSGSDSLPWITAILKEILHLSLIDKSCSSEKMVQVFPDV